MVVSRVTTCVAVHIWEFPVGLLESGNQAGVM